MASSGYMLTLFLLGLCVTEGITSYNQYGNYLQPAKYPTSYQTYDKRALQGYGDGADAYDLKSHGSGSYNQKSYGSGYDQKGYGSGGYDQKGYGSSSYGQGYDSGSYGKSYGSSTYGKTKDQSYGGSSYGTGKYGAKYGESSYGYGKDSANHGYGYQTRTTPLINNKYYIPPKSDYVHGDQSAYSSYGSARSPYYKMAGPSAYHETTYGKESSYGKGSGYGIIVQNLKSDYKPSHNPKYETSKAYDACSELPEGDYALQSEFTSLFIGVDPQCNFIKCANYKAYVNPCSVGTKNDEYGGPHPKYGFCANLDHKRYCGYYPPPDDNYYPL